MKFKLGDRVVIKSSGLKGMITSEAGRYTMLGVTFEDERYNPHTKNGRVYYDPSDLEHDKSYIINEILKEI